MELINRWRLVIFALCLIMNAHPLNAQFKFWYDLTPAMYGSGITLGDVDGDGDLDLMVAGGFIKIYKNDGAGVLTESQDISSVTPDRISSGDIDNDGDLDIAVIGPGCFKIYKNDGAGSFSESQNVTSGITSGSIAFGDINNDCFYDLAVTGWDGGGRLIKIFTNNNLGVFFEKQSISPGVDEGSCVFGDVDSDGDLDFIVAGKTGTGGPPPRIISVYSNNNGYFSLFSNFNTGAYQCDLSVGDINSDGDLDLLVQGYIDSARCNSYTNNGNGIFFLFQSPLLTIWNGSLAFGDINIDGYLDGAVTGGQGPNIFNIYTNNHTGLFSVFQAVAPGVLYSSIALGDLDNDRDLDIIMTGASGSGPYTPHFKVYQNTNQNINNIPSIPVGLKSSNVNGYWRFKWVPSADDYTPQNLMRYHIAFGTNSSVYRLSPTNFFYPRGQANIGNVNPDRAESDDCYYQTRVPANRTVYWKVCAIDTSFKSSGYSGEQIAYPYLFSRILSLEPSQGEYFQTYGRMNGEASGSGTGQDAVAFVELKIKNIESGEYWNGSQWSTLTNTWVKADNISPWTYDCNRIKWRLNERHYAECRAVNFNGMRGAVLNRVYFIPVYSVSEKYSFSNYPNPFDPNQQSTCIEYYLSQDTDVTILVYDVRNGLVKKWEFKKGVSGARQGINRIMWDGRNKEGYTVANGVYFSFLHRSGAKYLNKIMVIK